MKKKHKTGYRTGDTTTSKYTPIRRPNGIPDPFGPFPRPGSGGKPPILWVKKNGKVVKATEEEIKTASKAAKKKAPKKIMVGGKYVKKGGKV